MAPFKQTTLPAHYKNGQTFGRPSEYRPEYCQLVIEKMREGISLGAFAGVVGVSRDTVYEWVKRHADFSDAVSRARAGQQLAWELKLLRSRKGAETSAAIFALKNIAPDQWRDVRSVDHQHSLKLETLTDAQLYAIAAGKAGAHGAVIETEFTRTDLDPQQ
ncbi:hypothetical protein [Bradyrhizobium sp. SEMIA]|uniref:hypothetical protein n=1 Tax=Bradyrhizobium sp. SEMIA TaxID=2597515 RepID=UPI0018A361AA|nr:hypothetical protein [Bradyrhizobium sp. SEMIA]QOG21367.1 hypothetical protein FOM02_32695 [Bradyrhizobium sp. SEMIA]